MTPPIDRVDSPAVLAAGPLARVRVVVYVTRVVGAQRQVLLFDHRDLPGAGTQVPAGGVHAGERIDSAARREVLEETGVVDLRLVGVLGVQQFAHPTTGDPRVSVFLHAETGHRPDSWMHTVEGDPGDEDSGLVFLCRFTSLDRARADLVDHQGDLLHLIAGA